MATSDILMDKSTGEKKEKTFWHNISVRNEHLIGVVESYVRKGSTVLIEGQLETRDYEKDGIKRYVTEVVIKPFNGSLTLMGGKKSEAEPATSSKDADGKSTTPFDDGGDTVPF
jgi:single-strand DNA-binding protein